MTTETTYTSATRFVALDVHRQYLVVGAVDAGQQVVLAPRRFSFEAIALVGSTPFDPCRCSRA